MHQEYRNLRVVIALSIPFFFFLGYYYLCSDEDIYLKNTNYRYMTEIYELYPIKETEIIMLGDSHTYCVNWNELFGFNSIANRGIRGDILPGFKERIQQVLKLHPKTVCIMGGINDLYAHYSVEDVVDNYKELIEVLKKNNIRVIVQSTLMVCQEYENSVEVNKKVSLINKDLRKISSTQGFVFCDINSELTKNNMLKKEYSIDGLHLNAKGYEVWKNTLSTILFM